MGSRRGKIARLPRDIRDELNRRIDNGEPGVELLKWLNSLPKVKKVLEKHFDGREINDQNLSDWKNGGFRDWFIREDIFTRAAQLAEGAEDASCDIDGRLTDHALTLMGARYAALLSSWDGKVTEELKQELRAMKSISQELARVHKCHLNSESADIKLQEHETRESEARLKALKAERREQTGLALSQTFLLQAEKLLQGPGKRSPGSKPPEAQQNEPKDKDSR